MFEYAWNGQTYRILTGVIGGRGRAPDGRFFPFFVVKLATRGPDGEELHRWDHDQSGASFATEGEGLTAAKAAAIEWIQSQGRESADQ